MSIFTTKTYYSNHSDGTLAGNDIGEQLCLDLFGTNVKYGSGMVTIDGYNGNVGVALVAGSYSSTVLQVRINNYIFSSYTVVINGDGSSRPFNTTVTYYVNGLIRHFREGSFFICENYGFHNSSNDQASADLHRGVLLKKATGAAVNMVNGMIQLTQYYEADGYTADDIYTSNGKSWQFAYIGGELCFCSCGGSFVVPLRNLQ